MIFKVPLRCPTALNGRRLLTSEEMARRDHGLEMHGRDFWNKATHRDEHERSAMAIRILKGERGITALDPVQWLGEVIMVAHEHEEEDY